MLVNDFKSREDFRDFEMLDYNCNCNCNYEWEEIEMWQVRNLFCNFKDIEATQEVRSHRKAVWMPELQGGFQNYKRSQTPQVQSSFEFQINWIILVPCYVFCRFIFFQRGWLSLIGHTIEALKSLS